MNLIAALAATGAWLLVLVPWRVPARTVDSSAPVVSPPPSPHRLHFVNGGAWWGASVVGAGFVLHPLVALVVLSWPSWRQWSNTRTQGEVRRRSTLRSLPETADLVGLGVAAGLPLRGAVVRAARWADEPYRAAFFESLRRADAGEPFAAALAAAAADLDPVAAPLVRLLATADADGGAVLAGLVRLSHESRRRRRTEAAARARRLPVTMLLPLVLCVLPAFGLLAVAPLVVAAVGDLDLGF
jgi:Flp pilus assembly protein TadB